MKSISIISLLFVVAFHTHLFAQTKVISHRSHSGSMHTFSKHSEGNFGLPVFTRVSVTKLSDTSVVETWDRGRIVSDTVTHHPIFNNPAISSDSLHTLFPNVKLIGFTETKRSKKYNRRKK